MLKFVLDDYRRGFKSALKNNFRSTGWFIYFYALFVMPAINHMDFIKYLCGMIPIMLGLLLSRMYPNQMSKIFFLCPLTKDERMAYLETAYKLRISIPMALCLVSGGLAISFGRMSLFYYIIINALIFFYLIGVNIYCIPIEKSYDLPGVYNFWNILLQIIGLIGMVIFSLIDIEHGKYLDKMIMAMILLAEMGTAIKMKVTYYRPVIERGLRYETSYAISEKQRLR